MGLRALVIIWFLSVMPLALGWASDGTLVLGGALQVGPVLLPWLFLAGMPRKPNHRRIRTTALLGLAVPPIALALGLDLAEGVAPLTMLRIGLVGFLLIALLSHAANRAARQGRALAKSYSVAWLVLVPLPSVLLFLRVQAALPASTEGPGAWTLGSSPLTLVHALAQGADPNLSAWLLASISAASLLLLCRSGAGRDNEGAEAGLGSGQVAAGPGSGIMR